MAGKYMIRIAKGHWMAGVHHFPTKKEALAFRNNWINAKNAGFTAYPTSETTISKPYTDAQTQNAKWVLLHLPSD